MDYKSTVLLDPWTNTSNFTPKWIFLTQVWSFLLTSSWGQNFSLKEKVYVLILSIILISSWFSLIEIPCIPAMWPFMVICITFLTQIQNNYLKITFCWFHSSETYSFPFQEIIWIAKYKYVKSIYIFRISLESNTIPWKFTCSFR